MALASGRGSDFASIANACADGTINARIAALITDNPTAGAIAKAVDFGIDAIVLDYSKFPSRAEYEKELLSALELARPELIVLAGYMRIIRSHEIFSMYKGKIINIHPSLLPKYPGAHAQKDAFDAGEKVSGYTIHFVNESLDGGPAIFQEKVDISHCQSADEAAAAILEREHMGLPKVVGMFADGKVALVGKEVKLSRTD